MPKPKRADDVFKILRDHDPRFEIFSKRGKGSHRLVYHPDIGGKPQSYPVPYHKGHDVSIGILKGLIRRFQLPAEIFG